MGRPGAGSQTTTGQTYPFRCLHNLVGSVVSETYPSGRTVATTYDGANPANAVTGTLNGTQTNYVANAGYAPHGGLATYKYGNNLWRQTYYNNRLQTSGYIDLLNNNTGSELLNVALNWGTTNNNGDLRAATYNNVGTGLTFAQTYQYEGANRLALAGDSGWSRSFGYDAFGNMWVTGSNGIAPLGNTPQGDVFNGNNQIVGVAYDSAGNQVEVNGNIQGYDAENRLIWVTFAGANELYFYDGNGQRVGKSRGSGNTVYVYDALGQLAAEYATAANGSPCTTCYLSADHLGSTRLVTDGAGSVIGRHDYLPFGEEIAANTGGRNGQWGAGNDTVNQKFTDKERDAETALDYFGARYFGSALGRFSSPDPSNLSVDFWLPQTWNRYSYGVNNPLSIVDRNGLWPTWVHNQIINEAFPGLSKDQLKNLQTASKNVDSDQSLAGAYKHGMANGQDPNGAVHAEMDSEDFIKENEHDAEAIQADWIAFGHTGIAPGALTAFANALHNITDKTSPSHEYFQPWYGVGLFDLPEAGYHFVREAWPWGGNQQRQQNAVNAARAVFLLIFGSDAASQAETPKKKEDVSSKVCYQTDNGQVCQ